MPAGKGKGKGKGSKSQGKDQADKGKGKGKSSTKGKGKGKGRDVYVWRPKLFRKKSLFSTQSFEKAGLEDFKGAELTELRTSSEMLGVLECILVEPMAKKLAPKDFSSTGVVVCLHGMPPSKEASKEWAAVVDIAGWTNLGCSVIIPNVQMSAALQLRDFEAIVDAALELADFNKCLIVGKAWGGQCAVEIASKGTVGGKVEGVILVAPSSPPPSDSCSSLCVPCFLMWSIDDNVSAFSDSEAWLEALDNRVSPTTFVKCKSGEHRVDAMLADFRAAQALRSFTAAALLIGELEQASEGDDPVSRSRRASISERAGRLTSELPGFLKDAKEKQDNGHGVSKVAKDAKRFSLDIQNWMQAGMTTSSE